MSDAASTADDIPSDPGSPPPPQAEQFRADELRGDGTHPLWARSHGRDASGGVAHMALRDADLKHQMELGAYEESAVDSEDEADLQQISLPTSRSKRGCPDGGASKRARTGDDTAEDDLFASDDEDRGADASADRNRVCFSLRGVQCVGCLMPQKIRPVDEFVLTHATRLADDVLWKQAAVFYRKTFRKASRFGDGASDYPPWKWKDIRAHYRVHVCDPLLLQLESVRSLQKMRLMLDTKILRVEMSNGKREIDRALSDQLLKVSTALCKEGQILASKLSAVETKVAGGAVADAKRTK